MARSSIEAKYHVVASNSAEANWVQSLLRELHTTLPSPSTIYCDNNGATYVCANLVFSTYVPFEEHVRVCV